MRLNGKSSTTTTSSHVQIPFIPEFPTLSTSSVPVATAAATDVSNAQVTPDECGHELDDHHTKQVTQSPVHSSSGVATNSPVAGEGTVEAQEPSELRVHGEQDVSDAHPQMHSSLATVATELAVGEVAGNSTAKPGVESSRVVSGDLTLASNPTLEEGSSSAALEQEDVDIIEQSGVAIDPTVQGGCDNHAMVSNSRNTHTMITRSKV
ncbi:hypothetical protein V6N13_130142 [Hibiscus sabdariffa]